MSNLLTARRLAIVPTLRCTLHCELCSNHIHLFKNPYDVPIENIKNDLDKLFELFDKIEWIQFVGGEVFIRNDMAEVYEYALRYKSQFDKLVIMTNATIAPRPEEVEVLKKYGEHCEIMISDYGKYSYKRDEMIAICDKEHIPYLCKGYNGENQYYDGWIDNSGFKKFSGTEEELVQQRAKCPQVRIKNMHCFNGRLHRCSNSCFMTELGVNKPAVSDYVDLYDNSRTLEEKKDIVRGFYVKPVMSCRICSWWNADHAERFPAAEQIEG